MPKLTIPHDSVCWHSYFLSHLWNFNFTWYNKLAIEIRIGFLFTPIVFQMNRCQFMVKILFQKIWGVKCVTHLNTYWDALTLFYLTNLVFFTLFFSLGYILLTWWCGKIHAFTLSTLSTSPRSCHCHFLHLQKWFYVILVLCP